MILDGNSGQWHANPRPAAPLARLHLIDTALDEPQTHLPNGMPDRIGTVAIVGVFCALTYVNSGAVPASVQTILLAVSLFTVLEVEGKGKWRTALRLLITRPVRLVFVALLLLLYLRRLLDRSILQICLDLVLGFSFLWAFEVIAYRFQKRVLAKSPDSKSSAPR